MKTNSYSHFILYSKGWYQKNHPYIDMQILVGCWTGCDPIDIDDRDIFSVLTTMVYPYINNDMKFSSFVSDCMYYRYGQNQSAGKMELFIYACMNVLNFLSVSGIDGEVAEPDYVNILPKAREYR